MQFDSAIAATTGLRRPVTPCSVLTRNFLMGGETVNFTIVCEDIGQNQKASSMVVEAFTNWIGKFRTIFANPMSRSDMEAEWHNILQDQNRKIRRLQTLRPGPLGTSVTAMLMTEENYLLMNAGASGAYHIRQDWTQLTQPTKAIGEVSEVDIRFYCENVIPESLYMLCSDYYHDKLNHDETIEFMRPEKLRTQLELQQHVNYLTLKQNSLPVQSYDCIAMAAVIPREEAKPLW
jgi:serine/threonine protein phosphatase PrpC